MNAKNKALLVAAVIWAIQYLFQKTIIIRIGSMDINLRDVLLLVIIGVISYQVAQAVQSGKTDLIGAGKLGMELFDLYRSDPASIANHVFAARGVEPIHPIGIEIRSSQSRFRIHEKLTWTAKSRAYKFLIIAAAALAIAAIILIRGGWF